MDSQKVTVMLPNARRQIVKVSPNKTMLEVLEEVCDKHNLDSNEFDLKHHNRIVDLTQMFRFAGLPNNGFLEMVEATQKRKESNVTLCLQLEDGIRPQGTFKPSQNLMDILESLFPESLKPGQNPVVIYMRKEIFGGALMKTTLKNLGIMSGRAVLRVINKDPEELKNQANVYMPSTKESKNETDEPKSMPASNKRSTQKPASDLLKTIKEVKQQNASQIAESSNKIDKGGKPAAEVKAVEKKYDWGTSGNTLGGKQLDESSSVEGACDSENGMDEEYLKKIEAQIIILGERNAVLFSLNEAQKVPDELPDAFFDLTVQDLQYLLRDLKRQTNELHDAPLLTEKLRDLENSKRVLNKLGQYKKSVIRVQFPNRLVLQGVFTPVESIEIVKNFVRDYLQNPTLDFYLFTIPPKKILSDDLTLVEADCVPTAVLHLGIDSDAPEELLKPEFLSKLTTPDGAVLAASRSRGVPTGKRGPNDPSTNSAVPGPSTGAIPKQPRSDDFKRSNASKPPSGNVPKWFKPLAK